MPDSRWTWPLTPPNFYVRNRFVVPNPDLTFLRALAIVAAGSAAGFMNSIVGSGTLISFPTLVGVGFGDIAANVANNIGLFPGSTSAAYGYRKELQGQRHRLIILSSASAVGAVIGAVLLFTLSKAAFTYIVPFLILIGVTLVLLQPTIVSKVKARQEAAARDGATVARREVSPALWLAVCAAGVYGGYFGAAQGVILIGVMGIFLQDELVRINAAKNVLAGVVGFVAAIVFVAKGNVPWGAAGLVAIGSITGGLIGAKIGRRIPAPVLRGIVATVGIAAATKLLWAAFT
jgi:uncharacterized protein